MLSKKECVDSLLQQTVADHLHEVCWGVRACNTIARIDRISDDDLNQSITESEQSDPSSIHVDAKTENYSSSYVSATKTQA